MTGAGSPLIDQARNDTLLDGYAPIPGCYDELRDHDGTVRPHWQPFVAGLAAMSLDEIDRRWRMAERLLHENGLAYTGHSESDAADRPWALDFVPVVIDQTEWRALERGLIQRARLLNAILADLYGPQRLLREGDLPSSLLFANPHFLRPAHGIRPKSGVFLHLYAADLGRGPDGRWRVLADRAQAPTGAGYALENRVVLSRCLPELFRNCRVTRLAGYFQSSHDNLVHVTGRPSPRIVLLTPGPRHEGYFAHAYIARYLGYSLAEGADLTVRDNRVYLQSVDGLKPVDLIVRRIDGEACDPLEMPADANLGVAGLMQAARAGSVILANAIGSGVVETKALLGFLPRLCLRLLAEDLELPSLDTWWCGDRAGSAHVLANLDALAIEPAFRSLPMLSSSGGAVLPSKLRAADRADLIDTIIRHGQDFVGHEMVALSTTPCWVDGGLQPRSLTLRVFLAARDDTYIVMPGGLARVWRSHDARALSLQRGERTKDTWVLSDRPVSTMTLLRSPFAYIQPKRTGKDLPSRAADNLFWLGRYAERAEDTIRALRSIVRRLTGDVSPINSVSAMERILRVLIDKTEPLLDADGTTGSVRLERRIVSLMFDADCKYGLQDTLGHLQRTAGLARDRLSVDAWRTLQHFHADATDRAQHARWFGSGLDAAEAIDMLDEAIRALAAFSGMEMENMTRNHGWRFLDMGRRLERAQHLSELLSSLLGRGDPEEDGSLVLLLELADSLMTYRSRYLTTPLLPPVIDLLLLDETNPRSVAFQVVALARHSADLPRDTDTTVRTDAQRLALKLLADIQLADIRALCEQDADGHRKQLDTLLAGLATNLPTLSELIARDYFSHAEVRRPVEL